MTRRDTIYNPATSPNIVKHTMSRVFSRSESRDKVIAGVRGPPDADIAIEYNLGPGRPVLSASSVGVLIAYSATASPAASVDYLCTLQPSPEHTTPALRPLAGPNRSCRNNSLGRSVSQA